MLDRPESVDGCGPVAGFRLAMARVLGLSNEFIAGHSHRTTIVSCSPLANRPHRRRPCLAAQPAQHRRGRAGHGQLRLCPPHRGRALRAPLAGSALRRRRARIAATATESASLAEAVADCTLVAGTGTLTLSQARAARRSRCPICRRSWPARSPATAALPWSSARKSTASPATTSPIAMCSSRFPPSAAQPSMNLGQAVAVCLYELASALCIPARLRTAADTPSRRNLRPASTGSPRVIEGTMLAAGYSPARCAPQTATTCTCCYAAWPSPSRTRAAPWASSGASCGGSGVPIRVRTARCKSPGYGRFQAEQFFPHIQQILLEWRTKGFSPMIAASLQCAHGRRSPPRSLSCVSGHADVFGGCCAAPAQLLPTHPSRRPLRLRAQSPRRKLRPSLS